MRAMWFAVIFTVIGSTMAPITAQEIGLRTVTNPFQEGFTYRVGEGMVGAMVAVGGFGLAGLMTAMGVLKPLKDSLQASTKIFLASI